MGGETDNAPTERESGQTPYRPMVQKTQNFELCMEIREIEIPLPKIWRNVKKLLTNIYANQ